MTAYNILDARNNLSRLIASVESGAEEVTITRRGRPVARLVAITDTDTARAAHPNRAIVDWVHSRQNVDAASAATGRGRTKAEIDAGLDRERTAWD